MGIFSKLTLRTAGSIPSDSARKGGRKDKKTDKETVPGEHRDRQMLRATVFFYLGIVGEERVVGGREKR